MRHPWSNSNGATPAAQESTMLRQLLKGIFDGLAILAPPKPDDSLSLCSDTWMIGAGRLYHGLLCDREAERISCREHILHIVIYRSHKAHHNLHTINHRVSKAEREWETLSSQQHQDSTGSGQLSIPEIRQFPSQALGESPWADKVITKQHSKSQNQHALHLAVIKLK